MNVHRWFRFAMLRYISDIHRGFDMSKKGGYAG